MTGNGWHASGAVLIRKRHGGPQPAEKGSLVRGIAACKTATLLAMSKVLISERLGLSLANAHTLAERKCGLQGSSDNGTGVSLLCWSTCDEDACSIIHVSCEN